MFLEAPFFLSLYKPSQAFSLYCKKPKNWHKMLSLGFPHKNQPPLWPDDLLQVKQRSGRRSTRLSLTRNGRGHDDL